MNYFLNQLDYFINYIFLIRSKLSFSNFNFNISLYIIVNYIKSTTLKYNFNSYLNFNQIITFIFKIINYYMLQINLRENYYFRYFDCQDNYSFHLSLFLISFIFVLIVSIHF
jgi:hypothetical protein